MENQNLEQLNQPLGRNRRGSKFDLQTQNEEATLYRPEFGEAAEGRQSTKRWDLMKSYLGNDKESIQKHIVNHVEYTLARTRFDFDNFGAYQAAAYAVRDRLIESWNDTQQFHTVSKNRRYCDIYILNLECRLQESILFLSRIFDGKNFPKRFGQL